MAMRGSIRRSRSLKLLDAGEEKDSAMMMAEKNSIVLVPGNVAVTLSKPDSDLLPKLQRGESQGEEFLVNEEQRQK